MPTIILPGTTKMVAHPDHLPIPSGWVDVTGVLPTLVFIGDDQLAMDPLVSSPYLVEWSAAQKAAWLTEHGGDLNATANRLAKEMLDSGQFLERVLVSLAKALLDEVRKSVPTVPDPNRNQIRNAVKAVLNSGFADIP